MEPTRQAEEGAAEDRDITPAVIAEELGWSHQRAVRFMTRIEATNPGIVTRRRGRGRGAGELSAKSSRIRPFLQALQPSPHEKRVDMLHTRVKELEQRLDAEARGNIEFRRKAHLWFERVASLERKARAT